jgi:hypothetical protein
LVLLACLMGSCARPGLSWRADLCGDPELSARRHAQRPTRAAAVVGAARTRNVVLVTIDGTRWQEIFRGVDPALAAEDDLTPDEVLSAERLLPNIHRRLIARGIAIGAPGVGAPITASGPAFVSLPGYLELLTGRPSRCRANDCTAVTAPTLLDEIKARLSLRPGEVAAISSWDRIARAASADDSGVTVSAGRHGGRSRDRLRSAGCARDLLDVAAESGSTPGLGDYRADRYTARLALEYLRAERPRFLFVGLGDTDEHAHWHDYRGYLSALSFADRFLGELVTTLDSMGDYGAQTTVLVTADHGRAYGFSGHGGDAPESGRVFLIAAGGAVPARGPIAALAERHLADVAPTIRALLDLPPDTTAGAGVALREIVGAGLRIASAGGGVHPSAMSAR